MHYFDCEKDVLVKLCISVLEETILNLKHVGTCLFHYNVEHHKPVLHDNVFP